MAEISGCGTMFYGWKHQGEYSTATSWFTLFYVPVIPWDRYRLRALTASEKERLRALPDGLPAEVVGHGSDDLYVVHQRLLWDGREILVTYLKTYVLLPFLMAWPLLLVLADRALFGPRPELIGVPWVETTLKVFAVFMVVNAIVVPAWAIQSSRGYRGGLFRKSAGRAGP
ncbi:hypothetical protein D0B54_03440 [Solimonas sp. K1W22B-7]|uniref:hypothetical protein n=1 Tax=Solimonas sp. K1W22B-7 TaxID=2303331 RepID=UPI000E330A0C|nr:hypothetical protein [Solimonas sp. K1W22B-7]AXQ27782.1 hypothetical protein D0B54_03440 [Solimonas sp. K1W22B-7]